MHCHCWHLGEEEEGRVPEPCSIPKSLLRYYTLQFLERLEMLASGEDASGRPCLQDEQGKVWRLVLVYAKADEPDAEVVLRLGVAYQKLHNLSQARHCMRFPVRPTTM